MSKDIRSFFTVVSKKPGSEQTKRKPVRLSDSDEEIIDATPETSRKLVNSKKKSRLMNSDSETDSPKKDKRGPKSRPVENSNASKLKPINIATAFSDKPIQQSEVANVSKPKKHETKSKDKTVSKGKLNKTKTELGIHDDNNFEQTLLDLDDSVLVENIDILDRSIDEALNKQCKTNNREAVKEPTQDKELETEKANDTACPESSTSLTKKRHRKDTSPERPSSKKQKIEQTDSEIYPCEEKEKRRQSAALYHQYLNRGGPRLHGMIDLPKGKPDCLKDLCFLRTGVLDSLENDEFEDLVTQHGGRVVHSVSKKVNYIVVGEEPGPAKVAKAEKYNIPRISESDLLNLIRSKSGLELKEKPQSEDLGIGTDSEGFTASDLNSFGTGESNECINSGNETPVTKEIDSKEEAEVKREVSLLPLKDDLPKEGKIIEKKEKLVNLQPIPTSKKDDKSNLATSNDSMQLSEKYKPQNSKSIIGQQSDSSNMNKLKMWLLKWYKYHGNKQAVKKPNPWIKSDGSNFKCALLSGSPGVGKTTTATLVAQELGFDIVEFNASDTRSKKKLHEEVAQLLSSQTISGFSKGQSKTSKKRVLLMDEVDGMAGNEDRGGMQELIALIKNSSVPIICMCNDRNHAKVRSLANYCLDLRFSKPRLEQIRGAMMSVCFKEGIKITPQALTEIINGTGCDVRQTYNHLSMWSALNKSISAEAAEKDAKASKKDSVLGPWDVCRSVFNYNDQKSMSTSDKFRLFFYDYSVGPLFVQENYIKSFNRQHKLGKLDFKNLASSADSISLGDIISSKIRSSNNWSLLEVQALFSSVLPGKCVSKPGQSLYEINFPSWFGKNSSKNKLQRLAGSIQIHTRTKTMASKLAVKLDYVVPLRDAIVYPLKSRGVEGIADAISVMKTYSLLREDLDYLLELSQWCDKHKVFDVEPKVKAAFTRAYNKEVPLLPFAPSSGVSKVRAARAKDENDGEDAEDLSDAEENDDVTRDNLIKVSKKAPKKTSKSTDGPSTSKKSGTNKNTESKKSTRKPKK